MIKANVPESGYLCMPKKKIEYGEYSIGAVKQAHVELIRQWRNAQMSVLRQLSPITKKEQQTYFERNVWPDMISQRPKTVLLAYKENGILIGYGGLVHINWDHKRSEISFLLKTGLAGTKEDYGLHFPMFLHLVKKLAFQDLGLDRLTTELFDIRPNYAKALDDAGFSQEGILRDHVRINEHPVNSIIHGLLRKHYVYELYGNGPRLGNILLTSSSNKVPMLCAVKDAAHKVHPRIKVIAGDLDESVLTRYTAEQFWKMPAIDYNVNVFDELLAYFRENNIRFVIPSRDAELFFWAKNQFRFEEEGVNIIVSSAKSVQICTDKLAFSHFGQENGLPIIPSGLQPSQVSEGPFVVKERFGAGSRRIGLNLKFESALEYGVRLESPIFQPYIDGREISIDAWINKKCKVKGLVLRTRDRVSNGESQLTTTFRSPKIEAVSKDVLEVINLRGPIVMQAIIDKENTFHIVECNARFGGASTTAIAAGLDTVLWSLVEASGGNVDECPFNRIEGEVTQVRVPHDIHIYDSHF